MTGHTILCNPFYDQNHPLQLSFLYLHKACGPPVAQMSPCDMSGTEQRGEIANTSPTQGAHTVCVQKNNNFLLVFEGVKALSIMNW